MKALSEKYPVLLGDNLHGCKAFASMPHQPFEVDPSVPPVFRTHVRTTSIYLKETSKGFIKKLLKHDIIAVQDKNTDWCSSAFFMSTKGSMKPRFIIDFMSVNKSIRRAPWLFLLSDHAKKLMPAKSGFLIGRDLVSGYFHGCYFLK